MDKIKQKFKLFSKTAVICLSFAVAVIVFSLGIHIVQAAWDEPPSIAPGGNQYAPLNIGSDHQTKAGHLFISPLYNPMGELPTINNLLEVYGDGSYFTTVDANTTLTVDTDTLYADSTGVGVGTVNPGVALKVDGKVTVNNTVADTSAIQSQSSSEHGVYALARNAGLAAAYGYSANGYGVYGLNEFGGTGVGGYSNDSSAVVGTTGASYDPAQPIPGIYGRATGLGSWAGYFEQRLFGTDQIIGRKFIPNRLQDSQIPYTSAWQVEQVEQSENFQPRDIVYDGENMWAIQMIVWGIEPLVYLIDPVTGGKVDEFRIEDASGNVAHGPQQAIMGEDGNIWIASIYDDNRGLSKVDPDTHVAVHYPTGNHASGSYNGSVDLVYDDQSNGGPYIWLVNRINSDQSWSIVRFTISDGSYNSYTVSGHVCPTWNPDLGLDVDTELGWPSGITIEPNSSDFDNPTIWISFAGTAPLSSDIYYLGEGIGKFSADDANDNGIIDNFTPYCIGTARDPMDITYGGGYIWVGNEPHYTKGDAPFPPGGTFDGFTQVNPSDGVVVNTTVVESGGEIIKYDDRSDNGPYIWAKNFYRIVKFQPDGTYVHSYETPLGHGDFIFDHDISNEDYIWATHESASFVTKNLINDPYTINRILHGGTYTPDIAFDGTYIWATNNYDDTLSKYRASDGIRVGEYEAGWHPNNVYFDGEYIWTFHGNRTNSYYPTSFDEELSQIRVSDNTLVGDYDVTTNYVGFTDVEVDILSDGKYLWVSNEEDNELIRIDPDTCSGDTCTDTTIDNALNNPFQLAFDGQDLWVSRKGLTNQFSQIRTSDGAVLNTYTVPADEINDMVFDGTYLWIGTNYMDAEGNSVFKIDIGDGSVAGKYRIYSEPGKCNGGDNADLYCRIDSDCPNSTCSVNRSFVRKLAFDGIHIWVQQGGLSGGSRECKDDINNDPNDEGPNPEDKLCDYDGCCEDGTDSNQTDCEGGGNEWYEPDSQCEDMYDLHEGSSIDYYGTTTENECADGIDNDGNGLCDYDGGVGLLGCSGKPDPGCLSATTDASETARTWDTHLTRILAATGQVVESVKYSNYCTDRSGLVFDGSSIWMSEGSNCGGYMLFQYYSGSGSGLTDLESTVALQLRLPGNSQSGSFALAGSATLGANFSVVDDLVVLANTWGGSSDDANRFSYSCSQGEFAKGIQLSETTEFGTGGVITGPGNSKYPTTIVNNSSNIFAGGVDGFVANGQWRMEGRAILDGSLDYGVAGGGSGFGDHHMPNDMAIDGTYMYIVGRDDSPDWRIEKRLLSTGQLCTGGVCAAGNFGTDGSITETVSQAMGIAIDSTYMYVVGDDSRIEKRLLTTGALDAVFGGDGIINNGDRVAEATTFLYTVRSIAIDSTYMYVVGSYEDDPNPRQWAIEKRRLSDGANCTAANCGGTEFGTLGQVIGPTEFTTPDQSPGYVIDLAIDSSYIYVVGDDSAGTGGRWHIEKRDIADGSLVAAFGTGGGDGDGIVTADYGTTTDRPESIAIDSTYMYVFGWSAASPDGWVIEKRRLSDGSLCSAANCGIQFGTGGVISLIDNTYFSGFDISIDTQYMYLIGKDDSYNWRIEKRALHNGALGNMVESGLTWAEPENVSRIGVVHDVVGDPTLATDSSNNPHIAWMAPQITGSGNDRYDIHYLTKVNGDWYTATGELYVPGVTTSDNVTDSYAVMSFSPSLAIDANDVPHLAWEEEGHVYHLQYSSGQWETVLGWDYATARGQRDVSGLRVDSGEYPDLEIDSNNRPHVAYYYNKEVNYRWWNGSVWTDADAGADPDNSANVSNTGTENGNCSVNPQLSLSNEATQRPYIVWRQSDYAPGGCGDTGAVYLRRWDGSDWVTISGDNQQGFLGADLHINDDVQGFMFPGDPPDIWHAEQPDVSLDSNNVPYVTWRDPCDIFYKWWDASYSGWVPKTADANADDLWVNIDTSAGPRSDTGCAMQSGNPSILIKNDTAQIAWSEGGQGNKNEIVFRWWDLTDWVTISGDGGEPHADDENFYASQTPQDHSRMPDLAINENDGIHVAWIEANYDMDDTDCSGNGEGGQTCCSNDNDCTNPDYPICTSGSEFYPDKYCSAVDIYYTYALPDDQLQCRPL